MYGNIKEHLQAELQTIEENGIFKKERIITSYKELKSQFQQEQWCSKEQVGGQVVSECFGLYVVLGILQNVRKEDS
jgi:hypothetical protein